MNAEEIRQKAIECGENFSTMCASNMTFDCNFNSECAHNCPYTGLGHCDVVYGYEHGFADGVEVERKRILGMVDFWQTDECMTNERVIHIKHSEMLTPEQVIAVMLEQMKGEQT